MALSLIKSIILTVLPNEREVEWRMLAQRENGVSNDLAQRIAYGQSVTDHLMLEFYLVGERDGNDDFLFKCL